MLLNSERKWCRLRSVICLSCYHFLWPTHVHRYGLIWTDDAPAPGVVPLDIHMQRLLIELYIRVTKIVKKFVSQQHRQVNHIPLSVPSVRRSISVGAYPDATYIGLHDRTNS